MVTDDLRFLVSTGSGRNAHSEGPVARFWELPFFERYLVDLTEKVLVAWKIPVVTFAVPTIR
jgi:hypothetical protein